MEQVVKNPSSWKTKFCLSYVICLTAAGDLVIQGARASAAKILTKSSRYQPQKG